MRVIKELLVLLFKNSLFPIHEIVLIQISPFPMYEIVLNQMTLTASPQLKNQQQGIGWIQYKHLRKMDANIGSQKTLYRLSRSRKMSS